MLELKIESEYIKLDQFLKLADIASTGGHAKYLIQEGFVFPGEPWMCGSGYWFKNPQVLHENIELLSV